MSRILVATTILAILALSACTEPPRGRSAVDDPADDEPRASQPADDDRYDFEEEGAFPDPPDDVAFEEDKLPPAPEDMAGAPLKEDPVQSERVDETTDLPTPDDRIDSSVQTPVPPTVTTPVPRGSDVEIVRGFRVQLVAVTEHASAETIASEAQQRLGVPVHVVQEAGHFKVRAGDFTDRADAVRLKERATALGYDGCWVVTDQVELRR